MKQTLIRGIIGPKGSGKTYTASQFFRRERAAVFYDIAQDDQVAGFATAIVEAPSYGSDSRSVLYKEWKQERDNRIVWRSENLTIGKRGQMYYYDFDPLIRAMEDIGDLTFYVDEAHQICNPWSATNGFLKLIRMGRHKGVSITWIAQRFSTVHRELTANTDELILFRLWEPLDIEAIKNRCGVKTSEAVRNLRRVSKTTDGKVIPGETIRFNVLEQ